VIAFATFSHLVGHAASKVSSRVVSLSRRAVAAISLTPFLRFELD
jgi:hypothetical protein